MKRVVTLTITAILCGILLSGCSFVVEGINKAKGAVMPITLSEDYKTIALTQPESTEFKTIVFDNISFAGEDDGIEIKILYSENPRVEATYSRELDDYGFAVKFSDGEIKISVDKQRAFTAKKFVLKVYANFNAVKVEGGIPLSVDAANINELSLDVSGAVDAKVFGLNAKSAAIDVKGAAEVDISGVSESFSLSIAGAGELDGKELLCKDAVIEISGAGEADISVTDTLGVEIAGAGEVEYYGNPVVTNKSAGAAEVRQKSAKPYTLYGIAA